MHHARCLLLLRSTGSIRRAAWLAIALLAAALVAPLTRAQAPPAAKEAPALDAAALDQKIITEVKQHAEIMKNLTYLSDVIGARLTGSPNAKRANEWTAEKMKSYGLENVHLEPWTIPVGWERGTATARLIEPDNGKTLTVAAAGWSPGTKGKIEGEVVVVTARTPAELAQYKGKLKNAVVLRGAPANVRPITDTTYDLWGPPTRQRGEGGRGGQGGGRPAERGGNPPAAGQPVSAGQPPAGGAAQPPAGGGRGQQPGEFTPARFEQMMQLRREMADFLRKEGVAAELTDSGKPHGLLNMSGGWRGTDRAEAPEPLPQLYVTHDHYALLYRLATRKAEPGAPAPRTRIELEVNNKFIPGPVKCFNTVGEIRGTEKPDEYVVIGAHLDSWDLGQGTTDNGTGSSVVLETARTLAKLAKEGIRPKRTIRFILFTGEEQGLHGSRAYVRDHKDELPKISMALVHDTGTGKVTGIGLQGREAVKPVIDPELKSLEPLGFKGTNLRRMGGSDHASFDGQGVPGFCFQQDPAEYRLTHHSQSDTLDKAIEADLIQGAQVMAVTALRVANLPHLLPREQPRGQSQGPSRLHVFVGTYTGGKDGASKGIYRLELDMATGKLGKRELAAETVNPSFVAIHPSRRFLYAVSETSDLDGKKTGAISAFALDPRTGTLTFLNKQPSKGAGPCHLVVDKEGKHVLAANYGAGSACVLPIGADGKLGEATGFVQHSGSSVNKQRQEGPHAHSINLDAANRYAFVADLGLDKVLVYKYDAAKGTLTPNDPPSASLAPGAGPRHFAFSPDGKHAYVNNELDSTVTAFAYDADKGTLTKLNTVPTLPRDFTGNNTTAEVVVHPTGKFAYVSNRGHDSIAIFTIDQKTGELKPAGHQATKGKTPRNFAVDPTGTYLLAANQDSNSVVVFKIDATTGGLSPTDSTVEVPMPVCIRMVAPGR
jgi:6-phosphogluconolactonase